MSQGLAKLFGVPQKVVDLVDGATINTDASLGTVFRVTLAGNRTLAAPTNPNDGQKAIWRFKQDGTGTRLLTLTLTAGGFRFGTDVLNATLTTAVNKADYMGCIYNQTDNFWDVVSFVKGY